MKMSKITLILLSLLSLNSLYAAHFDFAILLERTRNTYDGYSSEEYKARKGNPGVMIEELRNLINDEEAIIVSTPLFRGFQIAAEKKDSYKKAEENLFYSGKWSIFATKKPSSETGKYYEDYEFVVLIPQSKYPKITERKKLSKIGLDPNWLLSINYYDVNLNTPTKAYKKLKNQISMQKGKRGKININTLLNLLSGNRNIEKRVYLSGHGSQEAKMIANLSLADYKKLRTTLNNNGCSFFLCC